MRFKNLLCFVLVCILVLLFSSCGSRERPTPETNENRITDLFNEPASESTQPIDTEDALFNDVVHTTDYPTYAFVWSDDDSKLSQESVEDEILSFVYTGEPIKLYTKLVAGGYKGGIQLGLLLYVNGILQTFTPCVAGSSYPGTTMFVMDFDAGEAKTVELQFQPNTGRIGEKLSVYGCIFQDPEYTVDASDETKGYAFHHDYGICGPFTLQMDADAPQQTDVCADFSGAKTQAPNELFKRVYDGYPDFGTAKLECVIKCGDFNTAFPEMDGTVVKHERIEATGEDTIDLCFLGHPGKYRAAFFVNNQLQNVFNGFSYVDFSIAEDMQTVISVPSDALAFTNGSNHCYMIVYGFEAPENLRFIKSSTYPVLYN